MNEMIERVAEAIKKANDNCTGIWEIECAKAAIAAMRKPTEEMIEAYEEVCKKYAFPDGFCEDAYQAMIDATLKE